ncbi:MAG: phosphatase PAP2 family protein [Alphaproteobacteria bacterium]|nr:phosphatase PAP2 family protein [Alphaproteobacteria bacterium]
MAFLWWAWFRTGGDAAARRRYVVLSIIGALAVVVAARTLQLTLPFHDRPLYAAANFVMPIGVDPANLSHWNSLPSDHAALFFALSLAVWYEARALGYLAMAWTLIVVCLPRLYLGYHYASDIVAGAILGLVMMAAIQHYLRNWKLVEGVVQWETGHRAAFYGLAFFVTYETTILFYDVRELVTDSMHVVKAVLIALA